MREYIHFKSDLVIYRKTRLQLIFLDTELELNICWLVSHLYSHVNFNIQIVSLTADESNMVQQHQP